MTTRKVTIEATNEEIEPLITAARTQIRTRAEQIIKGLCDSASAGHPLAAKVVIDLALTDIDTVDADKRRPLHSLAIRLSALPQLPPGPLEPITICPVS